MTLQEIANTLGWSIGSVHHNFKNNRKALLKLIKNRKSDKTKSFLKKGTKIRKVVSRPDENLIIGSTIRIIKKAKECY